MREKKRERGQMSTGKMLALDLLAILLGLNVFALFHHVIPTWFPRPVERSVLATPAAEQPGPEPESEATPPPEPEKSPAPTETAAPAPTPKPLRSGAWGEKFAEQFTDGEIVETEDSYRSAHISVTVRTVEEERLVYHVAEVYVSDLKYLRCALGHDEWARSEDPVELAQRHHAVLSLSGDHYFGRLEGFVIRDGVLYRESRNEDLCVLLRDGQMLTYPDEDLDPEALKAQAPWQVWSFGPRLLEDGKAREEIPSTIGRANPRAALGCVEPGHYFFVQVEGRGGYDSDGMTLLQLAALFEELGCRTAYNLDGGRTAAMIWKGERLSYPYGRPVYDLIYITDEEEETS